jgi:DNA-binding IclR family transcriptional regulator
MAHRDGVAAVDRALALLEVFDRDEVSLSLADLAAASGLVKSTVLRLAASLERGGFLRRVADGRYRLGPALARLGARYQASFALSDHVVPVLERLADTTGESASLYVREGQQRVCLFRVNSRRHRLLHFVQEGSHFPFDTGASGRVIQAFTEPDAPDPHAVRQRFVAVSARERTISDTAAVAAPVFEQGGAFVGALSLSGPASRFNEAALPSLVATVLGAAAEVTRALGGSTRPYGRGLAVSAPASDAVVAKG